MSYHYFISLAAILLLMSCKGSETDSQTDLVFDGISCTQVKEDLKNPTDFDQVVELVNALPKPLELSCFLYNFDPPFKIFAVDNEFSAQPSQGPDSPRILIIRDDFIVSVVPSGLGKDLIEFSKVTSSDQSIKGELAFPITDQIPADKPYTEILENPEVMGSGTTCKTCHPETHIGNNIYESTIFDPMPFQRVPASQLQTGLTLCQKGVDTFRCNILKAVFSRGEVEDLPWPF